MADPRMVGHAIRRRMGAPTSHLDAAHLPSDYGLKSWREENASSPVPGQKDVPDAGYMNDSNEFGTDV